MVIQTHSRVRLIDLLVYYEIFDWVFQTPNIIFCINTYFDILKFK